MKKRLFALIALLVTASLLCGCGAVAEALFDDSDKYEELAGTWSSVQQDTVSEATKLLENIDAYPEEMAAADLNCLQYVKTVLFTTENTYRFGYDIDGTKACVRSFFDKYFNDLYEVRTTLNAAYDTNFDNMTRDEFLQFYAELYSQPNYEALLITLTANAYRWEDMMFEGIENGKYTIEGNKIMCTTSGASHAESLPYTIEGNQLTLKYSNATEVYTKVN